MASFLAPQVDHNLYQPVLPQTNVGEIFQLINTKQQLYNSNLAKVNNQRSFISDLDDNLSSQFVKDKVNNFNKKVDTELRKYTNLDFSISDNVNLINNMYTPILKDQDFMIDYSTTSALTSEKQKGLAFRDSNDKDKRAGFSMTNLQYVTDGLEMLSGATDSKSLRKAAGYASQRYYSPYFDVPAHLEKSLVEYGASIEYDDVSRGYVVKRTGAAADENFSENLEDFLELILPENGKNQLKINSTVQVDNLVKNSSKEEVAADYMSKLPEQTRLVEESLQKEMSLVEDHLKIIPAENKRTDREREAYALLTNKKNTIENLRKKNQEREETYSKLKENLDNGTYSSDDIVQLLIEDVYDSNKDGLLSGLAENYSKTHSKINIDAASYSAANRLKLDYAQMSQAERFHNDDQVQRQFDNKMKIAEYELNLAKEGLTKTGAPAGNKYPESETEVYDTVDKINGKLMGYQTSSIKDNEQDISLFKNWWLEHTGHEPNKASIEHFKKGGYNENRDLRNMFQSSSFFNPKKDAEQIWFNTEVDAAIKAFNEEEGKGETIVRKNPKTGLIEYVANTKYESKVVKDVSSESGSKTFKAGETGKFTKDGLKIISRSNPNTKLLEYYSVDERGNTKQLEEGEFKTASTQGVVKRSQDQKNIVLDKFENYLKTKKQQDDYGFGMNLVYEGISYPSGKAGRRALDEIYGETTSHLSNLEQQGDNLWGTLKSTNPELNNDDKEAALLAFEKMKYLVNTESSKPGLAYASSKKGTKISFSDEDIAAVFDTTAGNLKDLTPEEKRAIQLLRGGMNFLIPHNKYTKLDHIKASVESGKSVTVNNLTTYKNPSTGEYKVYPKTGSNYYHYEFDSDNNNVKVDLTKNGYQLSKLKEPFIINPNSGFKDNLTENLYKVQADIENTKSVYETPDYRTALNKRIAEYLKTGKQLEKNADGTFALPKSLLPKTN